MAGHRGIPQMVLGSPSTKATANGGLTVEAEVTDPTYAFMDEAFPRGSLTLLLTPPGPEREALVVPMVLKSLKEGKPTIVALSGISPRILLRKLSSYGVDPHEDLKSGGLRILDWYSHKEEDVPEMVEVDGVLRSPGDLDALEGAISQILDSVKGKGTAIMDVLGDVAWFGEERARKFSTTLAKKLRKACDTSVLMLDPDLYDGILASGLDGIVDGIVEVAREASDGGVSWRAILRKDGMEVAAHRLEMKPPFTGFTLIQETPEKEVERSEAAEGAACPQCGSPLEGERCRTCGYSPDDSRLEKIKEIYERCEARLREDPKDLDALFTKAAALARMKEFEAAVESLNELTKHDPRYPALWMLKAKLYDRLGEEVKANLCRQRALEIQEKELGFFVEAKVEPGGEKFQCPLCQRWLPLDATVCPCGAEFIEEG